MKIYWIILFLLILPMTYAEECDWGINIISDDIFEYGEDFSFTGRVLHFLGDRTDIIIFRSIEDVYGNLIEEYNNITCTATRDKNCFENHPNLELGTYLIKGEIFPNCNDTKLENNIISKLIVILPQQINKDYTNIRINELFPNPQGYDINSQQIQKGEWIELYNSGDFALDLENLTLYDNRGKNPDIFISNSNTIGSTIIDAHNYLVIYMGSREQFLTNEGFEKISLYKEDYLIDEVSYSGSKEGLSWSKVNDYWIQTIPTPNEENYFEEPDFSSNLKIDYAYLGSDDKASFGDSLRVRIIVYKGDTTKYNLDLYLVDENNNQVSKRSEINIEDRFTNVTMIVPLQIEPNCNLKYLDGTYTIVLKGLDERTEKEIEVEGITESLCETVKIKEETSSEKTTEALDIQTFETQEETFSEPITSSVVYQSSDIKARNMGIYFFCAVLLLLIIYLIFKKTL